MTRTDKLLIAIFLLIVIMMVAGLGRSYAVSHNFFPPVSERDSSIVRLIRPMPTGGYILCSGTVVSDKYILTAAHCLAATPFDILPPLIDIRTAENLPLGITAEIEAFDSNTDLGLLSGDFKTLNHRSVVSGAAEINMAFKEHRIMICGYPSGGRFTCSEMKNAKNYNFKFKTEGFAYPGMSGGPVIDLDTGLIIGVTSAVDDDQVILSPFIEVLKDLHVESL